LWHERDISHSSAERVIMPDSTILMDYILHRLTNLLEQLRVLPENMARNLMLSHGLFFSQKVLLALVEKGKLSRQAAYEHVQALAMRCWREGISFPELARGDPLVREHLAEADLESLFDPAAYLLHEGTIYRRIFGETAAAPGNGA
jgi:adenylosuccinate lyase